MINNKTAPLSLSRAVRAHKAGLVVARLWPGLPSAPLGLPQILQAGLTQKIPQK